MSGGTRKRKGAVKGFPSAEPELFPVVEDAINPEALAKGLGSAASGALPAVARDAVDRTLATPGLGAGVVGGSLEISREAAPRAESGPSPFALERNLALFAGAGAGKTYSLITLCLHVLGGAREGGALRSARLCLLTFTEKAAAELRERLRRRLDALATGEVSATDEAELRASFTLRDEPFPAPLAWRAIRDELGSATMGTFHSLCVQLLRRAPAGFGVDPSFTLLEEREAMGLIADTAERVVLEALEADDPEVIALCRELGFASAGRAPALVEALARALTHLREEGLAPESMAIGDEAEARRAFDAGVAEARRAVEEAWTLDADSGGRKAEPIQRCRAALTGLTLDTFLEPAHWPAIEAALRGEKRQQKSMKRLIPPLRGADDAVGLLELWAAAQVIAHERGFRRLLGALAVRHREELDRRSVLDFSELLIRARDLLRDHPVVRREVQERYGALLVDEFQDTNRLQLELVTLIAERREGGARIVAEEGVLALPLEARFLCAVGDRKQSIYEFRGADVSIFSLLADRVEQGGGQRGFLQVNRRSSPALIGFFNRLFVQVLAPEPEPREYEVAYQPEGDDLRPHRTQRLPAPAVERIVYTPDEVTAEARAQDAEAVARRVRQMLAPRSGVKVEDEDGLLRNVRGGDIAILFRRFTYLELYRQALIRCGVPHRVVRGRGFYGAQEVLDMASLLALIADPGDTIAFAAVLRSPLVALSDGSLFKVALACAEQDPDEVEPPPDPHAVAAERALAEPGSGLFAADADLDPAVPLTPLATGVVGMPTDTSRPVGDGSSVLRSSAATAHSSEASRPVGDGPSVLRPSAAADRSPESSDPVSLSGATAAQSPATASVATLPAPLHRKLPSGRLSLLRLRPETLDRWDLPPRERERLDAFLALHGRLRRERDRLGLRTVLRVALEETGYRLSVAGTPYGEQALANLEKLLALAGRRDAVGSTDCATFAAELRALSDADPTEAQADVLDVQDERAVNLLTIHQAKGLEWNVVFVPDLAAPPRNNTDRVLVDRRLGLAIRPAIIGQPTLRTPRLRQVGAELRRRDAAETRRLLYVALTRARDRLVLSGQSARATGVTWRSMLDRALDADPALRAAVVDVRAEDLPPPERLPLPQGALAIEGHERVEAVVERVRGRPEPTPASAVFPVTHLQDYFRCPRRYLYAHQLGLSENPSFFEVDTEAHARGDHGRNAGDPRLRGTLAHALLERVMLDQIGTTRLRPHLDELLWAEGLSPTDPAARQIGDWVETFLRTPFAARLRAAGDVRVHRELPFLLRLSGEDGGLTVHLKGKIDLLFEDDDGAAVVVDYKASQRHAQGLEPYAFQLDCYALAARHFVQDGVPVRTGIAFLKERQPGPDLRPAFSEEGWSALEARLRAGAADLLRTSRGDDWPGRERSLCESMRCGYQYRCHAASGA